MPIALLAIGIIFLVAAVRGKHEDLFDLIKDDFTGPNNFFYWVISIWVIGAVGYYKPLRPLSVAFLTLVILILFLSNKGFFRKFLDQVGSTGGMGLGLSTEKYIQSASEKDYWDGLNRAPITDNNWFQRLTGGGIAKGF